jgi:hypothetical protein
VVARIPLARRGFPAGEITLRRTRIQYWDDPTSTWVDVVGRSGQDNPIIDWAGPIEVYDGSESRTFDIAPVTTTKVRALVEDGSTDGWSWLDELEAYEAGCGSGPPLTARDVDLALTENGVEAAVSSQSGAPEAGLINNGRRDEYGYHWFDGTRWYFPDWAQITWPWPRSLNRIVLRAPVWPTGFGLPARTLARVRVQYWDLTTSTWADVAGARGQANPLVDWVIPELPATGSELAQYDFSTLATTRIRAYFEDGTAEGYSVLDDIHAYWMS